MSWFSKKENSSINWEVLESEEQLKEIISRSNAKPQLIFKHSTRCSVSFFAKKNFEKSWNEENNVDIHYLDLIAFRNISNAIENTLNVMHQSPQVILIVNEKAIYNASHNSISADDILNNI